MKLALLYFIVVSPAVPFTLALGAPGIPLGLAAGFLLLLTIECVNSWRQGWPIRETLRGVTGMVLTPWRYRVCKSCGKFHHRRCWGGQ